jgi:hypothetical protein
MPYFLAREPSPGERRVEVAPQCYRSRAEALAALKLQRGRWTIISAPSWREAVTQLERGRHSSASLPGDRTDRTREQSPSPAAYTPLW